MAEHCADAFAQEMERRRYQSYVTDALMATAENTARYAGGSRMRERWADGFKPEDTRTGDEIAADFIKRAGLKFADAPGEVE